MKKVLFPAFLAFSFFSLSAQAFYATTDSAYMRLVEKAYDELRSGACAPCLVDYEAAFAISQRSILSRLRAASCAFACKQDDKWKFHLDFALEKDWISVENILQDKRNQYPELTRYRDSAFYDYALQRIADAKKQSGYDEALAAELEIILRDDQALRQGLNDPVSEAERMATWRRIEELDSINLVKVEDIFARHGYPGKSKVGKQLSSAAFLVIQHADLAHQEKHFPLLEQAANAGELDKSSLALLIDRIRMRKGEKQLYGSQVTDPDGDGKWDFHPIEDEANVDKRRAEMGLGPLAEYARHFGIEYKPVKQD